MNTTKRLPVSMFNWFSQGGGSSSFGSSFAASSSSNQVLENSSVQADHFSTNTASKVKVTKETLEVVPGVTLATLLQQRENKPRQPGGAFTLYVKERVSSVRASNPGRKVTGIIKELSDEWKNLSPSQKDRYLQASKRETEKYQQALNEYNKIMGQKITLDRVATLIRDVGKRGGRPAAAATRAPRAISGYAFFIKETLTGRQGKPDLKALGLQWTSLSQGEKARWSERAKEISPK